MDGPELARIAAAVTATVRVRGPDPLNDISNRASFFLSDSSPTSSSSSEASRHEHGNPAAITPLAFS